MATTATRCRSTTFATSLRRRAAKARRAGLRARKAARQRRRRRIGAAVADAEAAARDARIDRARLDRLRGVAAVFAAVLRRAARDRRVGVARRNGRALKADANATEVNGVAEATKIKAIGLSEAEVTKQKTNAMGTEQYAIVRVAEALASNGIKLVPDILVSGKDGGGNGMIDALIGNEMLKKLQKANEAGEKVSGEKVSGGKKPSAGE